MTNEPSWNDEPDAPAWDDEGPAERWEEDEEPNPAHGTLTWRQLHSPDARRAWWLALWDNVCALAQRYQLPVRCAWWEDEIQVEALAALSAWVLRYDIGEWDDPPGKLSLLFELERIETLLRDGNDPFNPRRDRAAFEDHLQALVG